MKIEEVKPLQQIELNLLKEVDRICNDLGIKYYLIGGTLLGAVRHGGFIPWDVDIDIAMLRSDYEQFRKYCISKPNDKYFYEDYTTEKHHSECHAIFKLKNTEVKYTSRAKDYYKLQHNGIYLDIFPLDYAPSSPKLQKKQQKTIKFLSALLQAKVCRDYGTGKLKLWLKKVLFVLLKPVSFYTIQKRVDAVMQQYNNAERRYIVSMASHYSYKKQLMDAQIYGTPKKIKFEGFECYAPAQTEKYLEQLFGDYMKLPPEETRYVILDSLEYVDYGRYGIAEAPDDK